MKALRTIVACLTVCALPALAEVSHIDNVELARLMAEGVPVIDIRTEGEWRETGIVPGSHLLTFFDERGRADPAAWLQRAGAIASPDRPVIVICRTGNRTRAVSDFLDKQVGYRKVYNVRAGIHGWLREGRAVIPVSTQTVACGMGGRC